MNEKVIYRVALILLNLVLAGTALSRVSDDSFVSAAVAAMCSFGVGIGTMNSIYQEVIRRSAER